MRVFLVLLKIAFCSLTGAAVIAGIWLGTLSGGPYYLIVALGVLIVGALFGTTVADVESAGDRRTAATYTIV